jgi:predicted nucleotidyltransferase/HEPN domain-containing protein
MRNVQTLESLLNKEIDKYRAISNVTGIGVLGSLAKGDLCECSDLDLVVLLKEANKDFFFEFDDQRGIPVDVMCITTKYIKTQPYVSSLFGCKVVYDPTNILLTEVEKTNNIHFSDEEISKRNQSHKDQAERFLEKANYSLEEHDLPSAIEHSRQAVLRSGLLEVEKSRTTISHHRRIAKYLVSFHILNHQDVSSRFLDALRLDNVDEKVSRTYDKLVRQLFENSYPWIHRKLRESVAPQWMDWTRKISLHSVLNWRILPIYRIGHSHVDFVDKVIDECEEFAEIVFEVNNKRYNNVTLVFEELEKIKDKPPHFSQIFREALRANNLTYDETRKIVNKAEDFINSLQVFEAIPSYQNDYDSAMARYEKLRFW